MIHVTECGLHEPFLARNSLPHLGLVRVVYEI